MAEQTAIVTVEQLAIEDVKRLANIVLGLRDQVFKQDLDFGVIPGTGTKPTLLLPGMEKLMRALHLRAEYVERSKIEDFDKSIIYYRYECRLIDFDNGLCVSTAIGSANSHETKWRWREQKRTCPKCGKETINRSKFAPKGAPQGTEAGWYCYAKAGGCGTEFNANDPVITSQVTGRIENPDIFDQMNTIDKIAQKRALSSAIKGAANVSEFFTVDLEDFQNYDVSNTVSSTAIRVEREPQQPDPLQWVDEPTVPKASAPPPTTSANAASPEQRALDKADNALEMPQIGNIDMIKLLTAAVSGHWVKGKNHFINLINLLQREGDIRDAMTADQVLEAIKRHEAAKDLERENG